MWFRRTRFNRERFFSAKKTWPWRSTVNSFSRSASDIAAIASRPSRTFSSKRARYSAAVFIGGAFSLPTVKESSWIRMPQRGSSAMCVASSPRLLDFACGFQSTFDAGTRSSIRRVAAISGSNSFKNCPATIMVCRNPRRLRGLGHQRADVPARDFGGAGEDRRLGRAGLAELRDVGARLFGDELAHLFAAAGLLLQQHARQPVHDLTVLSDDLRR